MTKRLGGIFLIVFVVVFFTAIGHTEDRENIKEKTEAARSTLAAESSHGASPKSLSFSVQVEACLDKKSALSKMTELKGKGYDAYVFQASDSNKQTWYAVRIGDYEDMETASQAASLYNEREKMPASVTYIDSLSAVPPEGPTPERSPGTQEMVTGGQRLTEAVIAPVDEDEQKAEEFEPVYPKEDETAEEGPGVTEAADVKADEEKPELEALEPLDQEMGEMEDAGETELFLKDAELEAEEIPALRELKEQLEMLQEEVGKLRQEAEARRTLKITEEEAAEREREILEAVSQEYTLARKGTIGMNYSFGYSYNSYDAITEAYRIEHRANHSIRNAIGTRYALRDNLTVNLNIPFVYKYDKVQTAYAKEVSDLGDFTFGWQWQPMKTVGRRAPPIVSGSLTVPMGRSPYKIVAGEMSTGSGFYSLGTGVSLSRKADPLVAFGGLSLSYSRPLKNVNQIRDQLILNEVHPGLGIGASFGIGYALSYTTSINMSFGYSYSMGTKYVYNHGLYTEDTGAGTSGSLSLGTGWRLSQTRRINVGIGIPLSGGTDFSITVSTPLDFEVGGK